MKRSAILMMMTLLLSACLPNPPPQIVADTHLGVSIAYGSYASVAVGSSDRLFIRPFITSHDEYGFKTILDRNGRAFISEAWSYGKKLRYEKGNGQTTRCRDRGNCPSIESGVVILDVADFQTAAQSGFEFELLGKAGSVNGKIAPESFRETLALKSKLAPVATSQVKITTPSLQ